MDNNKALLIPMRIKLNERAHTHTHARHLKECLAYVRYYINVSYHSFSLSPYFAGLLDFAEEMYIGDNILENLNFQKRLDSTFILDWYFGRVLNSRLEFIFLQNFVGSFNFFWLLGLLDF